MRKKSKSKLSYYVTLLLFSLIPLVVSTIVLSALFIYTSTKQLKETTNNAMISTISDVGEAFDSTVDQTVVTMQTYTTAPVITDYLHNPEDSSLAAKALSYTEHFSDKLDGYEGIYLANWDSTILAHPSAALIGQTMREGDSLEVLQSAMLASDVVYNTGIITSPASGNLIMSFYMPIFDGQTPIGYVGAGTYVNDVAKRFSDVSQLKLDSAYVYFIDKNGTILYHPDAGKIGTTIENDAINDVIKRLKQGETIDSGCFEYKYNGVGKYAAYQVGNNSHYIAILAADSNDVLSGVNRVKIITAAIAFALLIIFIIVALSITKVIVRPIKQISAVNAQLATGNVNVDINVKTHIKENISLVEAAISLKNALTNSLDSVKQSALQLDHSILNVEKKADENVTNVKQIGNAIDEVAHTSQSVALNTQLMVEQADDLSQNIDVLAQGIINLRESANIISESNKSAAKQVETVMISSKESADAINDITNKILETNKSIDNISACVSVIEEISSQTNLLSLNASIEAARAGEAGKGFSVVAEEIRQLSDSTASSSQEIKNIIESIMELSKETVSFAEKVVNITKTEQQNITETQDKFDILSDAVVDSLSQIENIKIMSDTLNHVKENLLTATNELGTISEELGASAEQVSATCSTVVEACNETNNLTKEMQGADKKMITAISFFKL